MNIKTNGACAVERRGGSSGFRELIKFQVFLTSLKACEEREQRHFHCHFKTEIKCQVHLQRAYTQTLIYMTFHINRSINIDTYFSYHYPRLLGAFIKVIWPGKHLLLIPLFYYLSNPFLHRMTNFIPTAAPIFPLQLLLPRAARQVCSPSPAPTTLLLLPTPPEPQGQVWNWLCAPALSGWSRTKTKGPEKTCGIPPGVGEWETNPTLLQSDFFVFLQLHPGSTKASIFTFLLVWV